MNPEINIYKTILEKKLHVKLNKKYKNRELLILYIHLVLINEKKFECIGIKEDSEININNNNNDIETLIYEDWNKNSDLYIFKYKASKNTFILNFLPIGESLMIHALSSNSNNSNSKDDAISFEIKLKDYIDSDLVSIILTFTKPEEIKKVFKNLEKLQQSVLIPIFEKYNSSFLNKNNNYNKFNTNKQDDVFKTKENEENAEFIDEKDPLRMVPIKTSKKFSGKGALIDINDQQQGNFFKTGEEDLYPNFEGIGFGKGGEGGMLIGPNHPGFNLKQGGNNNNKPPFVPPGAKFDEFLPPGVGNNKNNFKPNPTHLKPPNQPNYDNSNFFI